MEFLFHVFFVGVYGFDAQVQLAGNFDGAKAFAYEGENLELAVGEGRD